MRAREFEHLVAAAIDAIPERFHARMRNVVVVVEDEPTVEQLRSCEIPAGETMYAYYDGIALTERDTDGEPMLPDQIVVFRRPLVVEFGHDPEMLRREVTQTIMHEVAHYFGIDDDQLDALGKY